MTAVSFSKNLSSTSSICEDQNLLQTITDLIKDYERKNISRDYCVATVTAIIPRLKSLIDDNLYLGLKGCCLLLKLDDDNLREIILKGIKTLFHCNFPFLNIDSTLYEKLIDIERDLSQIIESHITYSSNFQETLWGLLDLYQDVLEHLWLLPLMSDAVLFSDTEWRRLLIQNTERWLNSAEDHFVDERHTNKMASMRGMLTLLGTTFSQAMIELIRSKRESFNSHRFLASISLGRIYLKGKHYLRAADCYLEALEHVKHVDRILIEDDYEATCFNSLGIAYDALGRYDDAFSSYERCLILASELKNETKKTRFQLKAHQYFGNVALRKKEHQKAIQHYELASNLAHAASNHREEKKAYKGIAEVHLALGQPEKATHYFIKSLPIALENEKDSQIENELRKLREDDLFHTREILCYLFKLTNGSLLERVIKTTRIALPFLLRFNLMNSNRYVHCLELEKCLSETIEFYLKTGQAQPLLISLLDFYCDILENLWLLPCLLEIAEITAIKAQYDRNIETRAKCWLTLGEQVDDNELKKKISNASKMLLIAINPLTENVKNEIKSLTNSYKRLDHLLDDPVDAEIYSLFHDLDPSVRNCLPDRALDYLDAIESCLMDLNNILVSLGGIYLELKHYANSIDCIFKSLNLIGRIKKNDSTLKLNEMISYNNLGCAHMHLGEYGVSFKCFQICLNLLKVTPDPLLMGLLLGNLGQLFFLQRNYEASRIFFNKQLTFASSNNNQREQKNAYRGLASICSAKSDYQKAIEYYLLELELIIPLKLRVEEATVYDSLALVYINLRQFEKAKMYLQKSFAIAIQESHSQLIKNAYSKLSSIEQSIGNYEKSVEYQELLLEMSGEFQLLESEKAMCLNNIGMNHFQVGNFKQAKLFLEQCLELANKSNDLSLIEMCYSNLATVCVSLKDTESALDYLEHHLEMASANHPTKLIALQTKGNILRFQDNDSEALKCYKEALKIACELENLHSQIAIYISLGDLYRKQNLYDKSIKSHRKGLELACSFENPFAIAMARFNLAYINLKDSNNVGAEKKCRKAIAMCLSAQKKIGNNKEWQITHFEQQFAPYAGLEVALINQGKYQEALEVTESRRSRALNSLLAHNLSLEADEDKVLTIQEMQELAKIHCATFVVYSTAFEIIDKSKLFAWIISADTINSIELSTDSLQAEMQDFSSLLKEFPFYRDQRAAPVTMIPSLTALKKLHNARTENSKIQEELKFVRKELRSNLARWYEALIAPLESYLPQNPQETLVFVLEGFLSQLPFGLFLDYEGNPLINRFPITTIPSLKTLYLRTNRQLENLYKKVLLMGNPDTGDPEEDLEFSQGEVLVLKKVFQQNDPHIFTRKMATPECIKREIQNAHLIFLSCHGLISKKNLPSDPNLHSIFEGCLQLSPDSEHSCGYLDSKEISELKLAHANFVCISACFSGTGQLWREGSIGLVRSFIAAGAPTVLAAYWPVYESKITLEMIELIATNLTMPSSTRLTHAHALQQIMKTMMKKYPDHIEEWGVFFLTGV